jgi:hypothetical protein
MNDREVAELEAGWASFYADKIPDGYISGLGRDYPHPKKAHLYKGDFNDPGLPMCHRGWNRDEGESYSIWRKNYGIEGLCQTCLSRARQGLDGIKSKVLAVK